MARLSGKAAKANWRAAVGPDNSSEYLEINASQAPLPGASEVPQRRLAGCARLSFALERQKIMLHR